MIPIKNIYYMLSYAFEILQEQGYKNLETENFDNINELMAAILSKGVLSQIKRGLGKVYIENSAELSSVRGKIDICNSIKSQAINKKRLICIYDDLSENTYMNQIIKSTMNLLLGTDINKKYKKQIRRSLVYLKNVQLIDLKSVKWNIRFNKSNKTYKMLISICYLVVNSLLQTQTDGNVKLMDYLDEKELNRLYEKFILQYYKTEFKQIKVNSSQIKWSLDDNIDYMLPIMQSDIMLKKDNNELIIDAKFYSKSTQTYYNNQTIHSNNLYQIFTYVKNEQCQIPNNNVSGMLLYAMSDDGNYFNNNYKMSGNAIAVKTLNLNQDFKLIANDLNKIVYDYFSIK